MNDIDDSVFDGPEPPPSGAARGAPRPAAAPILRRQNPAGQPPRPPPPPLATPKRRPGRPPGSKNRAKSVNGLGVARRKKKTVRWKDPPAATMTEPTTTSRIKVPPVTPVLPPMASAPVVIPSTTAPSSDRRAYLDMQVNRAAEEIRRKLSDDRERIRQRGVGVGGGQQQPSSSSAVDRVLDSYVPTRQTMSAFESLDVLVCGKCRTVFHNVDEFKSHSATCKGPEEEVEEEEEEESSEAAVAMVLWCNTMRRLLVHGGVQVGDMTEAGRIVQTKWSRLSRRSKETWLKAARGIIRLGQTGKIVFGGRENYARLVEEVLPLTENECRPDMVRIELVSWGLYGGPVCHLSHIWIQTYISTSLLTICFSSTLSRSWRRTGLISASTPTLPKRRSTAGATTCPKSLSTSPTRRPTLSAPRPPQPGQITRSRRRQRRP